MNFSRLMDSARLSDTCASFDISDDWLQGRTVYGGLQGAIAVKAMRQLAPADAPLRSLQVTFIGPVVGGEVRARASLLRQGKSAAHVQAVIEQEGKLRLLAVGIFARGRESQASHEALMPAAQRSFDDAHPIPFKPGERPPFLQHFDVRVSEGAQLFSGSQQTENKSYARHCDDDSCSEEHLTALADLPPPLASVQLTQPAPGSSMNWQLDFVRSPAELVGSQWYRLDAELAAAGHGYSYQNGAIWNERGELVMLSRQLMAVFG